MRMKGLLGVETRCAALYQSECPQVLQRLPADSVRYAIMSPSYQPLRDLGQGDPGGPRSDQ